MPEQNPDLRDLVNPQKILSYLKGRIDTLENVLAPLRIAFCKAVEVGNFGDADVLLDQIVSKQAVLAACAEEFVRGTAYESALGDIMAAQGSEEPVN